MKMIIGAIVLSVIPILNWPFSWLETFFHELSHGLAAILTGGSILNITLTFDGAGTCTTRGGWPPLITWAGYAGAALWGMAITMSASESHRRLSPALTALLMATMLISTICCMSNGVSLLVMLIIYLLWMAAVFMQAKTKNAFILKRFLQFSGIYVTISAVISPLYQLISSVGDSKQLARMSGISEGFWVLSWELLALGVIWRLWQQAGRSE
ncbi:MAG: M50 family metallopeptidase [Magnetococcales bacterium]|nr:M50 family metallopeptidase [Magnetococcales bacterium]